MSGDKKIKKFIGITATMLGTVFAGMEIWVGTSWGVLIFMLLNLCNLKYFLFCPSRF